MINMLNPLEDLSNEVLSLSCETSEKYVRWQKLHSHAYTGVMVCSFVSFTYYLVYLRRRIAMKIRLWRCLLHRSFPSHSW
jgi:hypothetical protein